MHFTILNLQNMKTQKYVSIVDVSAFVDQLTIEALRRVENNTEPPCEAVRILFFTNK